MLCLANYLIRVNCDTTNLVGPSNLNYHTKKNINLLSNIIEKHRFDITKEDLQEAFSYF